MRFAPLAVVIGAALQVACAPASTRPATVAPPAPTCRSVAPPRAASVAATASAPPPAAGAATTTKPTPPLPAAPAPLPRAFVSALEAAAHTIATRRWAAADKQLANAAALAGHNPHLEYLVAHLRATRFVYAGDFEHAAGAFLEVIPTLAKHPELPDEFWSHNAMMMIREAQGDPAAALAENDQATLCAARGTWDPKGRDTLAFQKDRWHRAYLTRMLAESRSGSVKRALIGYARAALDDYRTRGFPDSVSVLEAYFAALDGDRAAALAAARRVDPSKDDDVEDLYLVVVGLQAGGDHAAAARVERAMPDGGRVNLARAIMLRWLEIDAKKQPRGFTPWHATGH
jgi:hypothetical protein